MPRQEQVEKVRMSTKFKAALGFAFYCHGMVCERVFVQSSAFQRKLMIKCARRAVSSFTHSRHCGWRSLLGSSSLPNSHLTEKLLVRFCSTSSSDDVHKVVFFDSQNAGSEGMGPAADAVLTEVSHEGAGAETLAAEASPHVATASISEDGAGSSAVEGSEDFIEISSVQSRFADDIEYIPPPPAPPDIPEVALNALGEPAFSTLGLGAWTPVGFMENVLEYLHASMGLPWYGAIAVCTVIIRMCVFPLVLKSQKLNITMQNHMPQMTVFQKRIMDARKRGNMLEMNFASQEMMKYMKDNNVSYMQSFMLPMVQLPIFVSMFLALRKCANLPVESMKEGGLWWFHDLTVADPFYILPIITSVTMFITIEVGADFSTTTAQTAARTVIRVMPLVILPLTIGFPAAILCYWVSTNIFTLMQVSALRIPTVRDYFGIPKRVKHAPEDLLTDVKKKGFVKNIKDHWRDVKVNTSIEDRRRIDEMRFRKAGTGPVVQTFKHNPLKKPVVHVSAKAKSSDSK